MKVFIVKYINPDTNIMSEYAITNSKSKIKEFMKYRNKEIFIVDEFNMNNDEYSYIIKKIPLLVIESISYVSLIHETYEEIQLNVMSNIWERNLIYGMYDTMYERIFPVGDMIPYNIFSQDIKKYLNVLYYKLTDIISTMTNDTIEYSDDSVYDLYSEYSEQFAINEVNCLLSMMRGDLAECAQYTK